MKDFNRLLAITGKTPKEEKIRLYLIRLFDFSPTNKPENKKWLEDADHEVNDDLLSFLENSPEDEALLNELNPPEGETNDGNHKLKDTDLTFNQVVEFLNTYNLMP